MIRGSGSVVCAHHSGDLGSHADISGGLGAGADVQGGPGPEVNIPGSPEVGADIPGGRKWEPMFPSREWDQKFHLILSVGDSGGGFVTYGSGSRAFLVGITSFGERLLHHIL